MRDEKDALAALHGQPKVVINLDAGAPREALPDPIPEVDKLLGLLSYGELDAADRSALEGARNQLFETERNGSRGAWLHWYCACSSLIPELTSRWQARAQAAGVTAPPGAPTAFALSRVKDAASAFLQRWQVRMDDQARGVAQGLELATRKVNVVLDEWQTLLRIRIPHGDQDVFAKFVASMLNDWSDHAERSLATKWREHLRAVVHEERLPSGPLEPPRWSHPPLTQKAHLVPSIAPTSVKRTSKAGAVLGAVGSAGASALAGSPLSVAVTLATLGATVRNLEREDRIMVEEQCRALTERLAAWAAARVEEHKKRAVQLVSTGLDAMRARLADWTDTSWPPPRPRPGQPDLIPLIAAANAARAAIAARSARLELEVHREGRMGS